MQGRKLLIILGVIIAGTNAWSQAMDASTHTLLIGKLEKALISLPPKSAERPSVTLRLADLYADRSRLEEIAKYEGKCDPCVNSGPGRKRAIELYLNVVNQLKIEQQGEVLLQLAHLQNQQDQTKAAIQSLNRAANSAVYSEDVTSRANANLGEIYFRQTKYALAESFIKKALSAKEPPKAGFLLYRLAWTQLNQGRQIPATENLIKLLNTPELLTREQDGKVAFDQAFHDDVTRDLVTFLARGQVNQKEIELLLNLSPEHLRRENIHALAEELERLGKKYSATLAWAAYYEEGDNSPSDSLETQVRLAQLQWDMGRRDLALQEYAKVTSLWRQKGCKGSKCDELGKRIKNFVVNWNKTDKDQPTRQCFEAYKHYLEAFSQDTAMTYMAATVADQLKMPQEANVYYARAAAMASDHSKDPAQHQLLEASLLKQIETAELTKDPALRVQAYDTYIEMNPKGEKINDVRYQKAHVFYETGKIDVAYDLFSEIVNSRDNSNRDLKIKSADLMLDILASKKSHDRLYSVAGQLAKQFPERATEFSRIQRQSAIQLAATALDKKDLSSGQLNDESSRLQTVSLVGASESDQILILKNRISLAERRQDLSEIQRASNALLNLKGLGPADREFALSRLVWVAELSLDFRSALKIAKKMQLKELSQEERHLKFAMLSELSGLDPSSEYRAALKLSSNSTKAMAIRATLVRLAKNPWKILNQYKSEFLKKPELFSTLIVESFSRDRNQTQARAMLKNLKRSPLAVIFSRKEFISQWQTIDSKLRRSYLTAQSDNLLQRSLAQRMKLLGQMEELGRKSIQSGDWETQLIVLTSVGRENQRLFDELMRLPVPRRLKGKDRDSYTALFRAKAQPFADKARQIKNKENEFWNNERALTELLTAHNESAGNVRKLLSNELTVLARLAPTSEQKQINRALTSRDSEPSSQEIAKAKSRVQRDPFDTDVVQELKRLSEARGETTMVAYLDARLNQMRKGVRR